MISTRWKVKNLKYSEIPGTIHWIERERVFPIDHLLDCTRKALDYTRKTLASSWIIVESGLWKEGHCNENSLSFFPFPVFLNLCICWFYVFLFLCICVFVQNGGDKSTKYKRTTSISQT